MVDVIHFKKKSDIHYRGTKSMLKNTLYYYFIMKF
jgi:hypothetical protein